MVNRLAMILLKLRFARKSARELLSIDPGSKTNTLIYARPQHISVGIYNIHGYIISGVKTQGKWLF